MQTSFQGGTCIFPETDTSLFLLILRFKEILDEDRVYNLCEDGGPKRALMQHQQTENLRIIGSFLSDKV
jgi:hypothetical protein